MAKKPTITEARQQFLDDADKSISEAKDSLKVAPGSKEQLAIADARAILGELMSRGVGCWTCLQDVVRLLIDARDGDNGNCNYHDQG